MRDDERELDEASAATAGIDERSRQVVRVSVVGIVANVLLAAAKAVFGLLANSIAIVLDAVNNLSDAASSVITIVGTKLAGRLPDREHPYGYGRIEHLTTIVIAVIVLWAGITSLRESVDRIINPEAASYDVLTLVVIAVAVLVKIFLGRYVKAKGTELGSDSLVASGTDATMDAVISASTLVAALIFMVWGVSLEAWLGAIISLVIIKAGFDILREAIDKILGERVDAELSREVKRTVTDVDGVLGAYDLFLTDYGPERLWGSVHVEVDETMTATQIDRMTREIQQAVIAKCGVVLHTVGVYSTNSGSDEARELRRGVSELALAHKEVIEVHGFFLDTATKTLNFDMVVDFSTKDRESVYRQVCAELAERYPQYTFDVTLDADMSD